MADLIRYLADSHNHIAGETSAMSFGTTISQTRKKIGLSQKDLATQIGISPQYLNDIEHDKRSPDSDELIQRIAKELKIEPDVLYYQARKLPPNAKLADVPPERIVEAMKAFRQTIKGKR